MPTSKRNRSCSRNGTSDAASCGRRCCCCCCRRDASGDTTTAPCCVLLDPCFEGVDELKGDRSLVFFTNNNFKVPNFFHRHLDWAALLILSVVSIGKGLIDSAVLSGSLGLFCLLYTSPSPRD